MSGYITNELYSFKKYHKNIYNIYFHIVCGIIFMTSFFLMFRNHSLIIQILYFLLLFITLNKIEITIVVFVIIFSMTYFLKTFNLSFSSLIIIFIIFYFLPDLSHYIYNEPTVLKLSDITILDILINIFYLLPFSLYSL